MNNLKLIVKKCSIDGCNKEGILQVKNCDNQVIAFICKQHSKHLKTSVTDGISKENES